MPPRKSALETFREGLVRTYGDRVVAPHEEITSYDAGSTGSLTVDWALRGPVMSNGGWVLGRIHELVGPPDSSKTTLMINTMASFQRLYRAKAVGYVDMEGTFDDYWATLNGLDLTLVDHVYADHAEDASDQARDMCDSGLFSLIVVDSVGGMESKAALEKDAADPLPGRNAQIVTRMCKRLAAGTRKTGTTVVLVNQLRAQIGSMGGDVSAGPKAMQHATTTRITMARAGGEGTSVSILMPESGLNEPVSQKFKARVARSKVGPTGRIAEFWVNNRATDQLGPAGINVLDEYVSLGLRLGVIQQGGGGMYTVPVLGAVKGRPAVMEALRGSAEAREAVRAGVMEKAA